ncbi:MAG: hypothetical protein ACOX8X_00540 [Methanomethylophilus sp.]|jgi:hypothetical protein
MTTKDDEIYARVAKYGITDGDWDYATQATVLTFERDKKDNVSSIYKGKFVYRDHSSEDVILPGETWIVSLFLNPKTELNYFAKGIMRVDAKFFFDLEKDQREEIVEALWKTCRKEIEDDLAERFETERRPLLDKEIREKTAALEAELADSKAKVASLENKIEEDTQIIDSLKKRQTLEEAAVPAGASDMKSVPGFEAVESIFSGDIEVRRIGPDTIYSQQFSNGRYNAHVSADRRMLLMVPSNDGQVLCLDGYVTIAGLNSMAEYNGEEHALTSKYSPAYGGVLIFIS